MGFTHEIRFKIKERANNMSELSERMDRPLMCCHLSHDRGLEEYNTVDMGVYVTDIEHYAYHLILAKTPELLGLQQRHNSWALSTLWDGIHKYNEINKIVMSHEELLEEIDNAKNYWFYFLGIES